MQLNIISDVITTCGHSQIIQNVLDNDFVLRICTILYTVLGMGGKIIYMEYID